MKVHLKCQFFPQTGWGLLLILFLLFLLVANPKSANAEPSQIPLFVTESATPLVMLNASRDHQLSYKAYNDFSDLTGDGVPETTYNDTVDYYGYFDSSKCYNYNTSSNRFVPHSLTTGPNNHYCSGQWSGNFLNWATMTRMDVVRKILYGGMRSTDTGALTVLERHYLPTDAHSFAKYYNGSDIDKLTPFLGIENTPPQETSTTSRTIPSHTTGTADRTFNTALPVSIGDQIKVFVTGNEANQWMIGGVSSVGSGSITITIFPGSYAGAGVTSANWTLRNLSGTGITITNLTTGSTSGSDRYSDTNTRPPLMRVARGNFALWTANERWQSYWSGEKSHTQSGFSGGFRSNGNRAYFSGINASAENPSQSTHGLGTGSAQGEYIVRVEVCNASLLGDETCKEYGSSLKPIGLLQTYGDDDQIHFGLMTGSFARNISGGVLRKNVSSFTDEVNESDGTFVAGVNGVVHNFDRLRIYGYDYNDGTYIGRDGCTYQQTGFVLSGGSTAQGQPANQGNCSSWGNPMSEMYLESLRYFAGKSANPDFTYGSGSKDQALGLTLASWTDPLCDENYCAPLSVINFNASVSGYDGSQVGGLAALGSTLTAQELTNLVGEGEGITSGSWLVGNSSAQQDDLCSPKPLGDGLGSFYGLCPEAPSQQGTYLISGMAYFANTNPIRSDLNVPEGREHSRDLMVTTYGVALATNVPKIEIMTNNGPVTIMPAYRLDRSPSFGGGTLVDFKIIEQTPAYGKYYVNWEDSEMGGDYDQDMWGTIEYTVSGGTITVTTNAVSASSANGQGFGYVISGTDRDGAHFHSGIYNFNFTDPTGVTGCSNCVVGDLPTSWTYTITGNSAGVLQDPLWYAAKWGGFNTRLNFPDDVASWDPTGDGKPDNFHFATNPAALVTSLSEVFSTIAQTTSSAAAVASNSTSLDTETLIYQARFNTTEWYGELLAYNVDPVDGSVGVNPTWDAEAVLPAPGTRTIITYDLPADQGRVFTWIGLEDHLRDFLDKDAFGVSDGRGQDRVSYLRGTEVSGFRERTRKIGDIVHSDPFYLGRPDLRYYSLSPEGPQYLAFRSSTGYQNRSPVIYIGANDGKLHAFHAETGVELFAYVPYTIFPELPRLTDPSYGTSMLPHRFYVDGNPRAGDAYINSNWRSVLVGTLGAGGKGVFALDVTTPDSFSSGDVLWEINSNTANYQHLGYTIGEAAIGRMANGKWAAIVGNGFHSTQGHAVLYIIDLEDGSRIKEITLDSTGNNGLASPLAIDTTGDRIVDRIYVGDLKGNMWGIDVGSSGTNQWRTRFGNENNPAPLFTAKGPNGSVQPITSRADASRHPDGGIMVYFGTGSFYKEGDNVVPADEASRNVYSYYGIRDTGSVVSSVRDNNGLFTALQNQTIIFEGKAVVSDGENTVTTATDVRAVSNNPVSYSAKSGWYMDLVSPVLGKQEERVVSRPLLRHGRIIFATLIPSTHACEFGGTSWLMELDALNGGRLSMNVFDINLDGRIDGLDYIKVGDEWVPASALQSTEGIVQTPRTVLRRTQDDLEFKYMTGSSGEIFTVTELGDEDSNFGRRSWRQLR